MAFIDRIAPAPRESGFQLEGYWVWGSSVVTGEDGRYHMFVSRWKQTHDFLPSLFVRSEIVRASADTPLGPYTFDEVVLPARGSEHWDGCVTHNPRIVKHKDTYILFHMGTTFPLPPLTDDDSSFSLQDPRVIVGRANKRVGIATSKSVFGPWKRYDAPVVETKANTIYNYLTSNPTPVIHDDGSVLLLFKSREYEAGGWKNKPTQYLLAARADHYEGPYTVVSKEPIFGGDLGELEDPFIWYDKGIYKALMKDVLGTYVANGCGIYIESDDGIAWKKETIEPAFTREVAFDDGACETVTHFERPSLLLDDGVPTHMFAAIAEGGEHGFKNTKRTRNIALPLYA